MNVDADDIEHVYKTLNLRDGYNWQSVVDINQLFLLIDSE